LTKAIIWDMDGVLADTGEAHFRAWQMLLADRGGITRDQFKETFGMANPAILKRWLGDDAPPALLEKLATRKELRFRALVDECVRILPGVLDWLERGRQRGYRQVVASSGEMDNIVAVTAALGIGNYFDALLSGAFLPLSKPDPAIFLRAAAAAGATPADCLVIEDAVVGVEAAHHAGMRCLAVTTTRSAKKLAEADLVVDSLVALDEGAFDRLLA
jgi:HAD superfamily hydrolase (TIGR01509 family)